MKVKTPVMCWDVVGHKPLHAQQRGAVFCAVFLGNQIDCATKQILKIKTHTQMLRRSRFAREAHEDVYITAGRGNIAHREAKQNQYNNTKSAV